MQQAHLSTPSPRERSQDRTSYCTSSQLGLSPSVLSRRSSRASLHLPWKFFFFRHILGLSIFHNPRDFSLFLQKYLNISKKNDELLSTNNILDLIIFFLSPPLPIHLPNFVLPEAISNGLTYLHSTVISTRLRTTSYHHQIILYHNQIIKHDQRTYTCNIFFFGLCFHF